MINVDHNSAVLHAKASIGRNPFADTEKVSHGAAQRKIFSEAKLEKFSPT
jgi:hypothetical protein